MYAEVKPVSEFPMDADQRLLGAGYDVDALILGLAHATAGVTAMADLDHGPHRLTGTGQAPVIPSEGRFSNSWTANALRCPGSTDRNSVIAVSA